MNEVAYSPEALDNPNFVSRPPDPGAMSLYSTLGYDALYHSPFSGVYRATQLALEKDPYFDYANRRTLSPEDANKEFGLNGQLHFDEPIEANAARLMMSRKISENDRNYVIGSGMTTGFRQAAGIGVAMAATLLDPINTASMFIPVVGEARFARMVQRFGGSYLKARLAAGAVEGAVGMAMVEPFILLPALQEQANYGLEDSLTNLAYGAGLGAFIHAGLGAVTDRLRRLKPEQSSAIFEAAMNSVMRDEPVLSPARIEEFAPEEIRSAAMKWEDGTITEGKTHGMAISESGRGDDEIGKAIDGFTTSTGRFVSREEAMQIAKDAMQVTLDVPEGPTETMFGTRTGLTAESLPKMYSEHLDPAMNPTIAAKIHAESQITLDQIPRRDEKGRFLSQEKRLALLQEKINSDRTRVEQQDKKIDIDTKTNQSRLITNNLSVTSESTKVINDITKEADELEQSLFNRVDLDDEAKIELEAQKQALAKQMETEIGDPNARESGVRAGINCILNNLI